VHKHDDRDKGEKISQDRGGYCWCLVLQCYECMLMHIRIPSWCSIRCLFIRVWILSCCYTALTWVNMVHVGDKQLIWVWCNSSMNTALLALETSVDTFLWFGSVYRYLWNVLVFGSTWYVWKYPGLSPGVIWTDDLSSKPVFGQKQSNLFELVISKFWGWTTHMFREDKNLICLQAIKVYPNVTPSYVLMRSNRRGLWWICNESKPLPAYTKGWWAYGTF
jgi:hypothetical protein